LILGHLSDAVLAKRSMQASSHISLAVLWESVKRGGGIGSAFHERYNAILFHDRMEALQEREEVVRAMNYPINQRCLQEMRLTQEQCRFWHDVCALRRDWDSGRYTLLLAVPRLSSLRSMRTVEKDRIISELSTRLANVSDPLEDWLKQARQMCTAITGTLPAENLMIDLYHLKQHEAITNADYEAFTSVDPRAKRALPRQRATDTGET
jgi:hypothetical protein